MAKGGDARGKRACGATTPTPGPAAHSGNHSTRPPTRRLPAHPSHPLCYFPAFYLLKGAMEGRPVKSTMAKYRAVSLTRPVNFDRV